MNKQELKQTLKKLERDAQDKDHFEAVKQIAHYAEVGYAIEAKRLSDLRSKQLKERIRRFACSVPNAEFYQYDQAKGTLEIFFDQIHSKTYSLKEVISE